MIDTPRPTGLEGSEGGISSPDAANSPPGSTSPAPRDMGAMVAGTGPITVGDAGLDPSGGGKGLTAPTVAIAPDSPPERMSVGMGMGRDPLAEGYADSPQGLIADAAVPLDDAGPSPTDPAVERSESRVRGWEGEAGTSEGRQARRHGDAERDRGRWTDAALAIGAAALVTGGIALASQARRRAGERSPNDAPGHAMKNKGGVIGFTLAINRPADELYRRWREQTVLVRTMENVRSITPIDDMRSTWVMRGPLGADISFVSRITADEPGRRIAWVAEETAIAPHGGEVNFRDAPEGHGSHVRVTTTVPFGMAGKLAATIAGMSPEGSLRRDLKRFKQMMETGELATNGKGN